MASFQIQKAKKHFDNLARKMKKPLKLKRRKTKGSLKSSSRSKTRPRPCKGPKTLTYKHMHMNLKPALDLIKEFEGFEPKAYVDPATGAEPITIGYGTTRYPDGTRPKLDDVCTESQALEWLMHDLNTLNLVLRKLVKREPTNNQRCAMICLAYNIGMGAFSKSTLLRLFNAERPAEDVAGQFKRWNQANGKVMAGLTRRREAEARLFMQPDALGHGRFTD